MIKKYLLLTTVLALTFMFSSGVMAKGVEEVLEKGTKDYVVMVGYDEKDELLIFDGMS